MFNIYCSVEDLRNPLKEIKTKVVQGSKTHDDIEKAKVDCKRIAKEHYNLEIFGASDYDREQTTLECANDRCWKVSNKDYVFTYWC